MLAVFLIAAWTAEESSCVRTVWDGQRRATNYCQEQP